ncbi:MAG: hypothetical protein H6736_13025 [Alphaproteobacteria bacterium]|nr:hypothetical protein [Alphaproteobacteria bacterium]MCB9692726.1 hypothetical protein [Alphaproteobacteria bacterium]
MDGLVGRPAVLRDHATRFTATGLPWLEPRFLALEPAPGEEAHGVLLELEEDHWRAVIAHEDGYTEALVLVWADGAHHEATALVLDPAHRAAEGLPSGRYADRLVRGALASGLPEHVVERYRDAQRRGSPVTRWLRPLVAVVRRGTGHVGLGAAVIAVVLGILLALWAQR